MPDMNISIPSELMTMVEGKVASGLYNDANEVVCDALRQLDLNSGLIRQIKLDRLKSALSEGVEQIKNGDIIELTAQDIINELNRV